MPDARGPATIGGRKRRRSSPFRQAVRGRAGAGRGQVSGRRTS